MMLKTAEELKDQAKRLGLSFYPVHDCSLCGYKCGYVISADLGLEYDSGCYCTSGSYEEIRTWDDLAATYNLNQPENNPKISKDYLDRLNRVWQFDNIEKEIRS
jgi:hypothetical protein